MVSLGNVPTGARYLRDLLALAAFNAGENAVMKHGKRIPPITKPSAMCRSGRPDYSAASRLMRGNPYRCGKARCLAWGFNG